MFTEEEKFAPLSFISNRVRSLPLSYANRATPKRNLRRWLRSWEADGGAKESIRHKPRYSDVQKKVAVEHSLNHGYCLAFTGRTLGYPCSDVLAGLMNFIPTDDVYLPVRLIRLRPLNPK